MPARVLLLCFLLLAGCSEGSWPAGVTLGGTGPLGGTVTGEEASDVRAGR